MLIWGLFPLSRRSRWLWSCGVWLTIGGARASAVARVGDCTISIGESVWEERKFRERKFRGNEALSGLGILGLGFGVYYLGFGLVLRFVLELR